MAKCSDICAVYKAAAGADDTHRTVFIDEMSGIQALERIAPGLPMVSGKVERCEFEYKRHGTQTLIAAFNVTTGEVEGVVGNTRTEKDFTRFLRHLLSSAAAGINHCAWKWSGNSSRVLGSTGTCIESRIKDQPMSQSDKVMLTFELGAADEVMIGVAVAEGAGRKHL